METLTVLYDIRCELCRHVRAWLEAQPAYVQLTFVPAGSEEARWRFPQLDHAATLTELTVIGDGGEGYSGAPGWLICLWALRDYRAWALTLASPALMPTAQRFITWISQNRWRLGQSEFQLCGTDAAAGCSCLIDREVERPRSSFRE
jgi:predicted DCC family thiol-disulfide oxidoreductase YuxK